MRDNNIYKTQTLTVLCGYQALRHEVENAIKGNGFVTERPLVVIVDAPAGFALRELETTCPDNAIVVTDNPCPEYWDDLWDFQPQVLLAGGHSLEELVTALGRAAKGEHYRKTPHYDSQLTGRERDAFKLCAMGFANSDIATELDISEHTVKNHLSNVFSKLNLTGRGQVPHYYFGLWQWLPDRQNTVT